MTPGARRVLQELADDDECDIAEDRGEVYCGNRRTSPRVLRELVMLLAISVTYRDQIPDGGHALYGINETGRALLRRPELEQEIQRAIVGGQKFTVRNDRLVALD